MTRKQRRLMQSKAHAAHGDSQDSLALRDFREALQHLHEGRLQQSADAHKRVLARAPRHAPSLHNLGLIAFRTDSRHEAIDYIRKSLEIDPKASKAWLNLAVILGEARRLDEAIEACRQCVSLEPEDAKSRAILGDLLRIARHSVEAVGAYEESLKLKPEQPAVLARMSELRLQSGNLADAMALCRRALAIDPAHADARKLERHILAAGGRMDDTSALVEAASGDPAERARHYDEVAAFLRSRKCFLEAIPFARRAIASMPDTADYHFSLAALLDGAGRRDEALLCYQKGLSIDPERAEAYKNVGALLRKMDKHAGALTAFEHAVKLDPGLADGHYNLASLYKLLGRYEESRASFVRAIESAPEPLAHRFELANLLSALCDWSEIHEHEQRCLELLRTTNKGGVAPFLLISMPSTRADQLEAGRRFAQTWVVPDELRFKSWSAGTEHGRRIRIGYLSADYISHATAMLLAEVLEATDRSRFELFGYCYSPDDGSDMRRRIIQSFDRFVDINRMTDRAAAKAIHDDGIDILVDLKGYTRHARTEILAYRPAPIQVNYLGYPATMGADFIDYIVADAIITPNEHQDDYSERIVQLPNCYQPNDRQRRISDDTFTRAELGLPENGFVFCSFNNTYKITSEVFDVWMRLLAKVPGSVLWILAPDSGCQRNLMREAEARGIDPSRLVFADRMPIERHLARHRLADLFLDTLPCNAHTTASDALWAGLPVLTCLGETFSGRVAASLLSAMNLSDLIAGSLDDYERIALSLAEDRTKLDSIRNRISVERDTSPLFDTARYTRNLERAYETMVDIMRRGEAPRAFAVTESRPGSAEAATAPAQLLGEARVAYAHCPLCEAGDIPYQIEAKVTDHPLYKAELPPTVKWRSCTDCGHVFTEGYLTPEARDIALSTTPPHQEVGYDIEGQRRISARIVERVARYVPTGEWLDVGAGNGSLLFTAAEWGYATLGTDPRIDTVELLLRLGFKAYWGGAEDLESTGRFNVMSMTGALQNAPHPKRLLAAAHRMLRTGGVLFLSMPNRDTVAWRVMDASGSNPHWGDLELNHIFTRQRLVKLLEAHGFKLAEYAVGEQAPSTMEIIAIKV
ncbi:tetratricopeptide repeat protein [uncultured Hyphomicrobium sp.]|uniref:O-linked N-acetylglucosamine transferase family protein n=1 Tax=uncultured Hyphomicrobium sp. TaxID=194373 RepID=UPI0025F2C241|nr:tetratricopeptide repeat protein [uncultured Hyphomicrobium sp.]